MTSVTKVVHSVYPVHTSFHPCSNLLDFWRLDYWEDDLRRRRRFVRNAFGSTHPDVSLKSLEDYGQCLCLFRICHFCQVYPQSAGCLFCVCAEKICCFLQLSKWGSNESHTTLFQLVSNRGCISAKSSTGERGEGVGDCLRLTFGGGAFLLKRALFIYLFCCCVLSSCAYFLLITWNQIQGMFHLLPEIKLNLFINAEKCT